VGEGITENNAPAPRPKNPVLPVAVGEKVGTGAEIYFYFYFIS